MWMMRGNSGPAMTQYGSLDIKKCYPNTAQKAPKNAKDVKHNNKWHRKMPKMKHNNQHHHRWEPTGLQ
jgi:hypothetical protein